MRSIYKPKKNTRSCQIQLQITIGVVLNELEYPPFKRLKKAVKNGVVLQLQTTGSLPKWLRFAIGAILTELETF